MHVTNRIQAAGWRGFIAGLAACWSPVILASDTLPELTILVPAERGGGWDLTARAMAEALADTGGAKRVAIEYSPGAGGLIGLAQFVSAKRGQGDAVLVSGMFAMGAVVQNRSVVSLMDTTPLARLAVDQAVVAVPSGSRIRSAEDLIEAMVAAPSSLSWVGGSHAGVDEINILEIARGLGIPSGSLRYSGLPGGGEVGAALASGRYDAGISGYSEIEEFIKQGKLLLIATATEDVATEFGVTSFERLGVNLEHFNWRGVFAPPDITDLQRQTLLLVIDRMVKSHEWQRLLLLHHWQHAYLPGDEFVEFVAVEQQRIEAALESMKEAGPAGQDILSKILARRYIWALGLGILSALLIVVLLLQRWRARRLQAGLQDAFEEATGQALQRAEELETALAGISAQIERDFDTWNLTEAEREIALLLLKGLRFRDIADARGTSERTVRQQAQSVYKKAGLEGRSELAAFFIEDFMQSVKMNAERLKTEQ